MLKKDEGLAACEQFLVDWQKGGGGLATIYRSLYEEVARLSGVSFTFVARPGVSYSLRPVHARQTDRTLFAIMDVIDDEPEERWLSICFYGDMVTDPEERGDLVPGGLAGADGYCFDMYEADESLASYLQERLHEAYVVASR